MSAVSNNDKDLARTNQIAKRRREEEERRRRRREEEEATAPPPPAHPIDATPAVEVGCQVVGGILRCLTGAAFGQGVTRGRKTRGRKTRGRKTRGRKTRGRKTRGRKTRGRKRKNTKNTRYQKRAR